MPGRARLLSALVIVSLFSATGCITKGTASAKCGGVENFESRLGVINLPQLALGQVFSVNRSNKTGGPVGRVRFSQDQVTVHDTTGSLGVAFDSKLSIDFSANIPATVRATLASAITKSTELSVKDMQRRSLFRVIELLNADQAMIQAVENHIQHNPADEIHVVHAVMAVSSLAFSLAGSSSTQAGVSTVAYGDYELKVTYECSQVLQMTGPSTPAFFKSAPIGFDRKTRTFYFDSSVDPSLREINFMPAIR